MTENTSWQQPGADHNHQPQQPSYPHYQQMPPQTPLPPHTPYGAPGAPYYGYQQPYGHANYSQGWTAPVKPGLIPLRPLSFGNIIGSSFQVMRRNPRTTFGMALAIESIINILAIVIGFFGFWFAFTSIDMSSVDPDTWLIDTDQFGTTITAASLASLIPSILGIFGIVIVQGILVLAVSRETLGEKLNTRELFQLVRGRIGTLILWGLFLLGMVLGILVLYFAVFLPVIFGGPSGAAVTVLLAIVFILALIVFGVWIGTKISLVAPIIMLERVGVAAALKRSWNLTNQNFWRTLGPQAVVAIILSFVSNIIATPFTFIIAIIISMLAPGAASGDPGGLIALIVIMTIIMLIVVLLLSAVTLVAQTAATALVYIDLRMRKEGLDLELVRYVENKQSGVSPNPDPYLAVHTTQFRYAAYQQSAPTHPQGYQPQQPGYPPQYPYPPQAQTPPSGPNPYIYPPPPQGYSG